MGMDQKVDAQNCKRLFACMSSLLTLQIQQVKSKNPKDERLALLGLGSHTDYLGLQSFLQLIYSSIFNKFVQLLFCLTLLSTESVMALSPYAFF